MNFYQTRKKDKKITAKKCKRCGTEFLAKNTLAQYCGVSCKQQSYIDNKEKNTLISEIDSYKDVLPGLELLLESNPDDKDLKKIYLLTKGKMMLAEDKLKRKHSLL